MSFKCSGLSLARHGTLAYLVGKLYLKVVLDILIFLCNIPARCPLPGKGVITCSTALSACLHMSWVHPGGEVGGQFEAQSYMVRLSKYCLGWHAVLLRLECHVGSLVLSVGVY